MRVACVVRGNQVAEVRLLAETLSAHHPDWDLTVLLAPGARSQLPENATFRLLRPSDLSDPDLDTALASLPPDELASFLRPLLVRHLLGSGDDDVVLLPSNAEVRSPLSELVAALADADAVTVPRVRGKLPDDGERPGWRDLLSAGELDDELVAVRGNDGGRAFAEFWLERARERAKGESSGATPLDTAARALEGIASLDHPGYDVSYWNLHERPLAAGRDGLEAGGAPVRLLRFAGFRPDRPWWLSAGGTRVLVLDDPVLRELCGKRAKALTDAHWDASIESLDEVGDELPNGLRLDTRLRTLLAEAVDAGENFGELTTAAGAEAFRTWLEEPAPGGGGFSRYAFDVYKQRPDLRDAYPDLEADAEGYSGWLWVHGRRELGLQAALLPDPPAWIDQVDRRPPAVRVSGYLGGRLGLGQAARGYAASLRAAGVPVGTRVLHPDAPPRPDGGAVPQRAAEAAASSEPLPDGLAPEVDLVCVNADQTAEALPTESEQPAPYVIGQWAWETDLIPERWDAAFALVDEIWVYSTYVAEQIGRASPVPVIPVPLPVEAPPPVRAHVPFDLPADAFVFLFVFDHLSTVERKNPLGLIEAFRTAFEPGAGPRLVVKTINGHLRREAHERLRWAAGGREDILIADASLASDALAALYARADCYVSLHRSEGFGLTLAESMILGKPVIATAYGGNTDFMTPLNSYLVDWTLREVGPHAEHYPRDGHWAEPSVEHAAALMRAVYENPEERHRRGERARADITATLNPRAVGAIGRARLARIVRSEERAPEPVAPGLDDLQHRLAFDLTGATGRGGARGAARRALLRMLRPYTSAERALDTATADALRRLWVELEAERSARARDRARLERLERRLARLGLSGQES